MNLNRYQMDELYIKKADQITLRYLRDKQIGCNVVHVPCRLTSKLGILLILLFPFPIVLRFHRQVVVDSLPFKRV